MEVSGAFMNGDYERLLDSGGILPYVTSEVGWPRYERPQHLLSDCSMPGTVFWVLLPEI